VTERAGEADMMGRKDCKEAAALSKKRGPCPPKNSGETSEKRRKKEQDADGACSTSGKALHAAAAKTPRKDLHLCEHQRRKFRCKDSDDGGSGICEHQVQTQPGKPVSNAADAIGE